MIDLEIDGGVHASVSRGPHTSVMTTAMVGDMQSFKTFCIPRMKFLGHILIVYLVNYHVKLV